MHFQSRGLLACLFVSACFFAHAGSNQIKGKVTDPSGKPVPGAQVSAAGRVGIDAQTATAADGSFAIDAPANADEKLIVTAAGFSTASVKLQDGVTVQLEIAPQTDAVRVVGSAIDVAASEQGSSVTVISGPEIRERNEPIAADLLRDSPGVVMTQTGGAGGVTTMFLRGGNSNFTLVQVDGVTVNQFGGAYDFAHIPSQALDGIEVARGAQSAVYGAYANSGAVNFITRQPSEQPSFEALLEGGSYDEHRFGLNASATVAGFGIAATATRLDSNGPVINSDYWNELAMLTVTRRFGNQSLTLHGQLDANDVGEPGAYGSNPKGIFTGIDRTSRSHNDTGSYFANYTADLSSAFRIEATGAFYQNLSGFTSKYGFSYEKDWRGSGDLRAVVNIAPAYTMAFGLTAARESFTDTYVTNSEYDITPLRRNDYGFYWENRIQLGRLYLNAGIRGEAFQTLAIPTDGYTHPNFPENTIGTVNPKAAVAYLLSKTSRLHASAGTGMRPPAGFDLAFTTNPALKPERTASFDAGYEQHLLNGKLRLDATYFYNRYYDLIVSLGGSLTALSHFTTDNLANSRAQGAELSAGLRPARWLYLTGSYTLLRTRILSTDNSNNLAPVPFYVGEQLLRRPNNAGEFVAAFTKGRVSADLTGYFRGRTLDSEPNYGASSGVYWNAGYSNVGVNLNYAASRWLTLYGNLRNALDQHYEEIYGFPAPRLNFVAGMKITVARAK